MRTTITLDDELLAQAQEMTGITERSTLIHDGLRLLVQREAARRLAALAGSDPAASVPPLRRPPSFRNPPPARRSSVAK